MYSHNFLCVITGMEELRMMAEGKFTQIVYIYAAKYNTKVKFTVSMSSGTLLGYFINKGTPSLMKTSKDPTYTR